MSWVTSGGFTRARFCGACASRFWSKWSGTPTGDTITISDDLSLPMMAQGQEISD